MFTLIKNTLLPLLNRRKTNGFTLVEISIVIIIFGIITIPLLQMYTDYLKEKRRTDTVERVEKAVSQIRIYRANANSAPCPANRALNINNANFGVEDCANAVALAVGACTPDNGICKIAGARTPWATEFGAPTSAATNHDTILIGAYPFRTISGTNGGNNGIEAGLDGWNNKLTYAVTASATNAFGDHTTSEAVGKDFKYGVINAIDESGNRTAGINNDGLFVVLSNGPTARGAFSQDGALVRTCDITTSDGENCDNDATFRRAIYYSEGTGATFYDDYSYFFRDQTGELWAYMTNPSTQDSLSSIRKLNTGNVGVNTGTTTPPAPLTVNGAIRTPTALADSLCSSTGTDCVPTSFLVTPYTSNTNLTTPNGTKQWRNTCGAGQFASSIVDGKVQCVSNLTLPTPPGGAGANCPSGQYISAILSNGCIICTDGITYPSAGLCN